MTIYDWQAIDWRIAVAGADDGDSIEPPAADPAAALVAVQARLSELGARLDEASASDEERAELEALFREQRELRWLYVGSVPGRAVSRDPFTGLEIWRAIDPSLAGPWWDHAAPLREARDDPATLYALTGALALTAPVEDTPHLVAPGPAVPYVVPRLLEPEGTLAVVSSVSVGRHRAYVTAYYAQPAAGDDGLPLARELPVANEWPYDRWTGPNGWREVYADEEIDTDLGRWLDAQRLLWIAPDDERAVLRDGRAGCPYLEVSGTTRPQRIQGGATW